MKKTIKKTILTTLLVLGLLLLEVMYVPFGYAPSKVKSGYETVLQVGVTNKDAPVVDIKMLGAHDAFSDQITLASKADPGEEGILTSSLVQAVFKGGLVRVTRAQNSSAKELLGAGVRYFDVRISNVNGSWYTKHGLLSTTLDVYLQDIYTFLNEYPSEFIIFDVQHIFVGDSSVNAFLDYLLNTKIRDNYFKDYIHFSATEVSVGELTYKQVISSDKGGIILLINEDEDAKVSKSEYYYNRGDGEGEGSIRSHWHNVNTFAKIYPLVLDESSVINSDAYYANVFRVNQAQLTPDYLKYPLHTTFNWSLLDLAARNNKQYLIQNEVEQIFDSMPILMVDYANTKSGNFNQKTNELIMKLNQKL